MKAREAGREESKVPLSEDEKRILTEIEQHLYESDPKLVNEVSKTTVYTHAFRNMKWATLGFISGVVLMIALLSVSYVLAFGGFLLMLASVLMFERNARRLGKAGIDQMTRSVRGGSIKDAMGGAGARMRERFNRPDDRTD